jgi:predicted O-methyltransferase YrrM
MDRFQQLFSRYGTWNSIRTLVRYPFPVLLRFYSDIIRKDETLLAVFLGTEIAEVENYFGDLYKERAFFKTIESCQVLLERSPARGGLIDKREAAIIYAIVRHGKVEHAVETGVASGLSTAHLLLAMDHNGKGRLTSIDLPNTDAYKGGPRQMLPAGKPPGWIVPDYLKPRWTLSLGDARIKLPELMKQLTDPVDLFLHDSLHTYEHMMWEFETIWPHLRSGGILIADDAGSNGAIHDFCKKVGRRPFIMDDLGIVQKTS